MKLEAVEKFDPAHWHDILLDGAMSVGMAGSLETPMPNGMAWNLVVDENAPTGNVPSATQEQLWQRPADKSPATSISATSRARCRFTARRSLMTALQTVAKE